jgi:hypothetical protein
VSGLPVIAFSAYGACPIHGQQLLIKRLTKCARCDVGLFEGSADYGSPLYEIRDFSLRLLASEDFSACAEESIQIRM